MANRDYTIVGRAGDGRFLVCTADGEAPTSRARIWRPTSGLSAVKVALDLGKFNVWDDYDGPQDALAGVIPDVIFG